MALKKVIFGKREGGTFSVGDAPNTFYDTKVEIRMKCDGIEMVAGFFFKKFENPKICGALDNLAKAMIDEGAEEADIVIVG